MNFGVLTRAIRALPLVAAILAGGVMAAQINTVNESGAPSCDALPREWSAGSVTTEEVLARAANPEAFDAKGGLAPIDRDRPGRVEYAVFGLG